MTTKLIDPATVRKFIELVHERAAAAIYGLKDARPCVLHLDCMAPDDKRFWHSAYDVGDFERMVTDALIEAEAGKNVFVEPRLVRSSGRPYERGGLYDTQAVFASVSDGDSDTKKPFAAPVPASAVVETSPGNEHSWYFLGRAIGATDAVELGKMMRQSCGGDHCSGNPVQPFRVAGLPNYLNKKKRDRGRVVVPTRILRITNKTYTAEELTAFFSACTPPARPAPALEANSATHGRVSPAFCRSKARALLAAEPGSDRSARFMSAVNYAAMGGITAEEFTDMAQQHLNGCAGKYRDRLREEVDRCYAKLGIPDEPAAAEPERERRLRWHQEVTADPELTAGALRFAGLILHHDDDGRHVRLSIQTAAAGLSVGRSTLHDGRDLLVSRKWLIPTAVGSFALGRGPRAGNRRPMSGTPDTAIGNDNE